MSESLNVTRIRESSADTKARVSVLENQVVAIAHNIEKLETKVDGQYSTLHHRISDLRDDLSTTISQKHDQIVSKLDDQSRDAENDHRILAERLNDLEKWRWMLIGAAAVVGYILAHLKLEKFF